MKALTQNFSPGGLTVACSTLASRLEHRYCAICNGRPAFSYMSVQTSLESLIANQCSGLTSVALQLPVAMPLKELSISGKGSIS